jgi:hypothetical protein
LYPRRQCSYLVLRRIDILHDSELKLPEYIFQGSIAFRIVVITPALSVSHVGYLKDHEHLKLRRLMTVTFVRIGVKRSAGLFKIFIADRGDAWAMHRFLGLLQCGRKGQPIYLLLQQETRGAEIIRRGLCVADLTAASAAHQSDF